MKITGTIVSMSRRRSTPSGGPVYLISLSDGWRLRSQPDAADAYGWSAERLQGRKVEIELDDDRKAFAITPIVEGL